MANNNNSIEDRNRNEEMEMDIEELSNKAVDLYATDEEFRNIPAVKNLMAFLMSK